MTTETTTPLALNAPGTSEIEQAVLELLLRMAAHPSIDLPHEPLEEDGE